MALVGSGEFLPGMAAVDAELLDGRPPRAVVLPTAAAREGDARVAHWLELARAHFDAMGVESVGLDVRTRADATDPHTVSQVDGAGLVYLSGGDPHHLADTLRSTPLWDAIAAARWEGVAIGGCSAGAMALTAGAPDDLFAPAASGTAAPATVEATRAPGLGRLSPGTANGLALLPGLAVVPHFDSIRHWHADALTRFVRWRPEGTTLVGIDDDTALLRTAAGWRVRGTGSVWVFDEEDERTGYRAGETVDLG